MPGEGVYRVIGVGQCAYDIVGTLDEYPPVDQKA